ncbi:hypothetical protein MY3296_001420 [Beauveria thailandica]
MATSSSAAVAKPRVTDSVQVSYCARNNKAARQFHGRGEARGCLGVVVVGAPLHGRGLIGLEQLQLVS